MNNPEVSQEAYDVKTAAKMLGISEPSVRRAVAEGHMPTVQVPGVRRVLIGRSTLDSILRGEGATASRSQLSVA
jgi:excisionase family DNA binding protein